MLLTYHGPKATIAERLAAKNIAAISTPTRPDYALHFRKFIDHHAELARGKDQEYIAMMRDALTELLDVAFSQDKLTLGEAYNLQRQIRHSIL